MEANMATSSKTTRNAQILRIRDRNQITLSGDVLTAMDASVGDFLECRIMDDGYIVLAPTQMESRLAKLDSPEAEKANQEAEDDIAAGRYQTFKSVKAFEDNLIGKKSSGRKAASKPDLVHGGFARIQKVMRATGGDVKVAAKKLGIPEKQLKTTVQILHRAATNKA
jgi:hypothetical protein